MEDEDPASFGCPHCGYGEEDRIFCDYCSTEVDPDTDDEFDHAPYCSAGCAINAERDNEEDV